MLLSLPDTRCAKCFSPFYELQIDAILPVELERYEHRYTCLNCGYLRVEVVDLREPCESDRENMMKRLIYPRRPWFNRKHRNDL